MRRRVEGKKRKWRETDCKLKVPLPQIQKIPVIALVHQQRANHWTRVYYANFNVIGLNVCQEFRLDGSDGSRIFGILLPCRDPVSVRRNSLIMSLSHFMLLCPGGGDIDPFLMPQIAGLCIRQMGSLIASAVSLYMTFNCYAGWALLSVTEGGH